MKLPPAVMVHGLEQARAALAPGLAVTLLSGPAAAVYAGVGWWQALVAAASGQPPPPHVLDCGEATGRALEALRAGQRLLVLRAEPRLFHNVAERAAQLGGAVLAEAPPALDLAQPGAERRLEAWLRQQA
ncbi:MAG: hypothetical protein WDN04_15810 [Rhodospirillales bacterium]